MSFTIRRSLSGMFWHVLLNNDASNPLDVSCTKREAELALLIYKRIGTMS